MSGISTACIIEFCSGVSVGIVTNPFHRVFIELPIMSSRNYHIICGNYVLPVFITEERSATFTLVVVNVTSVLTSCIFSFYFCERRLMSEGFNFLVTGHCDFCFLKEVDIWSRTCVSS